MCFKRNATICLSLAQVGSGGPFIWPSAALASDPDLRNRKVLFFLGPLVSHTSPETSWIAPLVIKLYHYCLVMVCTTATLGYMSYS